MSGGTWAGRGERAALALVAPAHSGGTRHVGPSATGSGPSSAKGPSPGWPWAPLCLSGSKPASWFKAECSRLRVRVLTCAGVCSEPSKRLQNLSQGNSPFPGLSHGSPRSPRLSYASTMGGTPYRGRCFFGCRQQPKEHPGPEHPCERQVGGRGLSSPRQDTDPALQRC